MEEGKLVKKTQQPLWAPLQQVEGEGPGKGGETPQRPGKAGGRPEAGRQAGRQEPLHTIHRTDPKHQRGDEGEALVMEESPGQEGSSTAALPKVVDTVQSVTPSVDPNGEVLGRSFVPGSDWREGGRLPARPRGRPEDGSELRCLLPVA